MPSNNWIAQSGWCFEQILVRMRTLLRFNIDGGGAPRRRPRKPRWEPDILHHPWRIKRTHVPPAPIVTMTCRQHGNGQYVALPCLPGQLLGSSENGVTFPMPTRSPDRSKMTQFCLGAAASWGLA